MTEQRGPWAEVYDFRTETGEDDFGEAAEDIMALLEALDAVWEWASAGQDTDAPLWQLVESAIVKVRGRP